MDNADNIFFRGSSVGHLMVEPRSKSEILSESTKTHLIDVFVSEKYDRHEEIKSKFLEKGNECENDSLTLLSRITKVFYKKNEIHLSNDFIKGTPDCFIGESIQIASHIVDIKTSWSAHTFFRAQKDKLNPLYYWQCQSYMWLTGAEKATVAFCLVNGIYDAIDREKKKLAYKLQILDEETPEYIEKCKQIEINHIFDLQLFIQKYPYFNFHNDINKWEYDIPKEKRLFSFELERNNNDIERLKNKIVDCRAWMSVNLFNN